jgi:restriction endonuclease S subunit
MEKRLISTFILPKEWKQMKLENLISTIEAGKRPKGGGKTKLTNGIPSIEAGNLTPFGGFDFSELKYIPQEFFKNITQGKIKVNDILIVKDGATTGKVSFVDENFPFDKAAINEHIYLLRVKEELILPKYLFYYLYSKEGQEQIRKCFVGSAQGGINRNFLKRVFIPLPPLEEQKRIVAKLDEIFSRIEKARKLREEALKEAEQIMQSALNEVFSKAEEKGWKLVKLGDKNLFHIETGSTPKTNIKEYWENGNIKWITPKDLGKITTSKFILDTERKITQKGLKSCSTTIIPKGSIIISTRAPIGHIAITGDEMCFNQGCKGIVIKDKSQVLNDFLYYVLLTKVEEMIALGSGATFKEISRKKLASIRIPLPPLEEQKRIAEYLDKLYEKTILLKKHQEETQKEIEMLTSSVLNKAFTGNL